MSIYERLSNTDRQMITDYIANYADGGAPSDLEHVLRFWSTEKEKLYHMLGDQLIVSKPISIQHEPEHIRKQMERTIYDNHAYLDLYDAIYSLYKDAEYHYWDWNTPDEIKERGATWYKITDLFDVRVLCRNKWLDSDMIINIGDKEIKVSNGMSIMKAIKKVVKALGIDEKLYDDFRNYHSTFFQQKAINGTLHLSIHPLDFMTMSDNAHNWSSCMSWKEGGGYRLGTVETMNSPMVIVAYVTDDKKLSIPGDAEWNSKMWRTLIVVNDCFATTVKGYPYQSEMFAAEALKFLAEVSGRYKSTVEPWSAKWDCGMNGYILPKKGEAYGYADINTKDHAMYNDFGNCKHYLIWSPEAEKETNYESICYAGEAECMTCGTVLDYDDFCDDGEGMLSCGNCGEQEYCERCNCRIYPGDSRHWVDGELYCDYCYDEHTFTDIITNEVHHRDNSMIVWVVDRDDEDNSLTNFEVDCDTVQYNSDYFKYFTHTPIIAEIKDSWYYCARRIIYSDQITQKGLDLLDENCILSKAVYNKIKERINNNDED